MKWKYDKMALMFALKYPECYSTSCSFHFYTAINISILIAYQNNDTAN